MDVNSIDTQSEAYFEAVKRNLSIELDIRMTKDGYIICMHDRYTKRLLGKNGKNIITSDDVTVLGKNLGKSLDEVLESL